MFTSVVIKEVLDSIQQTMFEGGYELSVPYKFNRELDFSYSLHKDIVTIREGHKKTDKRWWCGMLFNRDPIKPYTEWRKRDKIGLKSITNGAATTFYYQSVETTINVKLFCSDLDEIETLEEWLCTRSIEKSYKVDYTGFINDVEVLVYEITYNGISQLEAEQFGTIGVLEFSFKISYPVLFDKEGMPIILEINFDLYQKGNNVLIEELQYREDLPDHPGKWKWFQGDQVI